MVVRHVKMAGRLFRTAMTDLNWHAHLVVESWKSSDSFNPKCFWISVNFLWFTRELLKSVYTFSRRSKKCGSFRKSFACIAEEKV